ncbi:MAG: winged helix-turn-helix domain-containing protein [Salinirussus sp.]
MSETRLTPEIELDGFSAEEAFSVLGDETRLDIIRVLWQAGALREYDDLDETTSTMSFSELRRRVDVDDNGRFNYHLSKLRPHFVCQTDDEYRLSGAGKKIARTVVAITGDPDHNVADEVTTDCPVCGGPVVATYEDQWLRFSCTECDGLFGDCNPDGTLVNSSFPAAGMTRRGADEAFRTSLYRCMLDLTYMMQGICRECAGPIRGSLSVCGDHDDANRPCEACGTNFAAWGAMECEGCRFAKQLPVELCVLGVPTVVALLYRHDVNVLSPTLHEVVDLLQSQIETSVTEDPRRVTATVTVDGDTLTLTLDDALCVVDIAD